MKKIYSIYFSATNTTKSIVDRTKNELLSKLGQANFESQTYDLLKNRIDNTIEFKEDDILIIGAPVYYGRLPKIILPSLGKLKGDNTRAILIISYGNREYDDALLELATILEENGFKILAAVTAIGQHSIFPNVAKGRPNQEDMEIIDSFSNQCYRKIISNNIESVLVPGNEVYREGGDAPIKPRGDSKCTVCGICSSICPTGAIDEASPQKTDNSKCISCGACIYNCPVDSRRYRGPIYYLASKKFEKANSEVKSIEVYI